MTSWWYDLFIYPIEFLIEFIFSLCYQMIGSKGYSILAISIVISFLVLPLYKRSDAIQEEERRQQERMSEWVRHIKRTFRGEERAMMLSAYYAENGYRPYYALRGSVSLLLQIPFFLAAYHFLSNLQMLNGASFHFIKDLGAPDGMLAVAGLSINVLPFVMTLVNILSGAIYSRGLPFSQKLQLYGMALLFLVLLYRSPAGLVLYWTMNNVFSLGKNILMKRSRHPERVTAIGGAAAGLAFVAVMLVRGKIYTRSILIFTLCVLLICLLPALRLLIHHTRMGGGETAREANTPDPVQSLLIGISLTFLFGGVIPFLVIGSSPLDFVVEGQYDDPRMIGLHALLVAAGAFLIWNGVITFLAKKETRTTIIRVEEILLFVFLINCFLLPSGLRDLSDLMEIGDRTVFSAAQHVVNLLLIMIAVAGGMLLFKKLAARSLRFVFLTVAAAMLLFVCWKLVSIDRTLKREWGDLRTEAQADPGYDIYRFSRTGKNVVVIMLDKGMSHMVPYLMEDDPALTKQFDGFVYYPNTLSFANHTNYGLPAVFGGYDYTTAAINERADQTLRDKHDEALTLMPRLFSEAGYEVTFCDPTYAGYCEVPDLSVFDGIPGVRAYNLRGHYMEDYTEYNGQYRAQQKHHVIGYSLYRALPTFCREWWYDGGAYRSVSRFEEQQSGTGLMFLSSYSTLEHLSDITRITDDEQGYVSLFTNDTVHDANTLQLPEYRPALYIDNSNYEYSWPILAENGGPLPSTDDHKASYESQMAAFRRLGEWFDNLRAEGVYDNTRIILVSDHGYYGWNGPFFTDTTLDNGIDAQAYNPLLLVKDFDARGFAVDERFMTNADVPSIAMGGLIENPVNPFTGNPVNSSPKSHSQRLTTATNITIGTNNGNTFDTTGGTWWEVTPGDIYDSANWKEMKP
ncbi:MAG: membrane protein insertase YidC [Lachnospiraceae bacterium]|nr:membrane protein insertase YidC [Lachnospiraceae bacterium]